MLKALVWKEWREQRPLLLAGLLLAALWPLLLAAAKYSSSSPPDLASIAEALPIAYAIVLWPLFTVAAGASTIANEIGDRTIEYLLSRPVSRARVWSVKITVGAASALLTVAGSLAVVLAVRAMAFGPGGAAASFNDLTSNLEAGAFALTAIGGAIFLLFSLTTFFSTFLPRAMTAAAAGIGASIAVLAVVSAIWSRLDLAPRIEPQWMALEISVIGALALLASLFVFSRGEMLRGRGVAATALLAALGFTGAGAAVLIPLTYAQIRLSPAEALLGGAAMSPAGDAVAVTAASRHLASPQVWLVHTDAPGLTRLGGRLTFGPSFSPDGRWIAYLSNRTLLGLRSDHVDLRAVRSDGSEDRLLATDAAAAANYFYYEEPRILFSPDGSKVAFASWMGLMVASLDGGQVKRLAPPNSYAGPILGWTRDGREILVPSRSGERGTHVTIRAYDWASGGSRVVHEAERSSAWFYWSKTPVKGMTLLPLTAARGESGSENRRLLLLDVTAGRTRLLSESGCLALPALSDDERRAAYATCAGTRGSDRRSEIHLLDLAGGQDRTVASIDGEVFEMRLSPGAERVLVRRRASREARITELIVRQDGGTVDIETGWRAVGWAGRDRLLLIRQDENAPGPSHLSVLSVETGAKLEIFP